MSKKIHINLTQKFTDKVIIGLTCFDVFMIFKIREQRRVLENMKRNR